MEDEEDGSSEERGELLSPPRERTWTYLVREGRLDTIVPLVVLALLSVGVVIYNLLRQQFDSCESDTPMAKHFYCYNSSRPPGFHLDAPIGRL